MRYIIFIDSNKSENSMNQTLNYVYFVFVYLAKLKIGFKEKFKKKAANKQKITPYTRYKYSLPSLSVPVRRTDKE